MWDTVDTSGSSRLSHDMPCPSCGHPGHRYLPCSDSCDCQPVAPVGRRSPALA